MMNKDNKDSYHNFSRKELQSLCKKYGLPANRSHSDLAKSLVSLVKTKKLKSSSEKRLAEAEGTLRCAYSVMQLPHRQLLAGAVEPRKSRKDTYGLILRSSQDDHSENVSQPVKHNEPDCSDSGAKLNSKVGFDGSIQSLKETSLSHSVLQHDESGANHNVSQRKSSNKSYSHLLVQDESETVPHFKNMHTEDSTCLVTNASNSPSKTSAIDQSSSIEFHVSSEEGINLYVDLNSSPLDWIQKFNSEVLICRKMHWDRFQILPQDLRALTSGNKDDQAQIEYSSGPKMIKDDHMVVNQPDEVNRSLISSTITSCNLIIDASEHSKEDQAFGSSENVCDTQNLKISGSEFFGFTPGTATLKGPIQHNSANLTNCSGGYPKCLGSCSMEMQSSEVASCQKDASCENDRSSDLVDQEDSRETEKGNFANSKELNDASTLHFPICVEEWERSKTVNMMETPECLPVSDSLEKSCFGSGNLESNGERKLKRKHFEGEPQSDSSKPTTRILRSTKQIDKRVSPRRSTRLLSK